MGRKSSVTIDRLERPIQSQWATLSPISFAYNNGVGRLAKVTQGDRSTRYLYDAEGNLGQVIDSLGRKTSYSYDPAGRLTRIILPDSRVISLLHNARGLLTGIIPPGRPRTVQSYNAFDNMTLFTPPALSDVPQPQTQFVYDLDQRLSKVIRPSGAIIDFAYDPTRGTLASINSSSGTNSITTDGLGRITGSETGFIALALDYDGPLQTRSRMTWSGGTAAVDVNALGLQSKQSVLTSATTNASSVSFAYDKDLNVTRVGSLSLTRDAATGLVVSDTLNSVTSTYNYNGFGELISQTASFGGDTLFSQALTRDTLGRIVRVDETAGSTSVTRTYAYDAAGRLIEADEGGHTVASYIYDSNSNRIGGFTRSGPTKAVYDRQDRLLNYGNLTFTHDANGQRLTMRETTTNTLTSYQFDDFGNLTEAQKPGKVVTYTIDGLGRRAGRTVNGVIKRRYLYDGQLRIVAELTPAGALASRFVYGPEDLVPQYMIRAGRAYRLLADPNGSMRMVVDASTGQILQQITYDEFGRVLIDTRPGFQPFGFAGGLYDVDTKLLHFGARDYDPGTGRWISQDPIWFAGGDTNLYGYALEDPIDFADRTGFGKSDDDDDDLGPQVLDRLKECYDKTIEYRDNIPKKISETKKGVEDVWDDLWKNIKENMDNIHVWPVDPHDGRDNKGKH